METKIEVTDERLTWDEIVAKYPDKWVEMTAIDWKNRSNVRSAVVIGVSDDNDEFLKHQFAGEDVFTRYTTPWTLY